MARSTYFPLLAVLALSSCESGDVGPVAPTPQFSHAAGGVLDQQQLVVDVTRVLAVGGNSEQILAQVVTAGQTGRLRELHLPISCSPTSDLVVEIRSVDATGQPTATVLDSRTFSGVSNDLRPPAPTFGSLDMGGRVMLTTGSQFAFLLRTAGSCGIVPGIGDDYPGGDGFFDARPNPPGLIPIGADLAFETFVRPTGPPP